MREKILVTGWDGFIGSHFVEEAAPDYEIIRFQGDITRPEDVIRNLRDIDMVVHFAALTWVAGSWDADEEYDAVNHRGTVNILKNHTTFSKFVYISTSHTYGNQDTFPITLNTVRVPADPYSRSKRAAEDAVRQYSAKFGFDSLIVRPFNNFGPRQQRLFVVPKMSLEAVATGKIVIKGDTQRELVFVKDNVRAIKGFIDKGLNGVVQVCKGETYFIHEVAEMILDSLSMERNVEIRPSDRPNDIQKLLGDPSSLYAVLPEFKFTPMEEAIAKTAAWYRDNR